MAQVVSADGEDVTEEPAEDAGPIARHLNRVIAAAQQRDARSYSNKDIAERSTALGYPLSPAQVSHIRLGRVRNPSFRTIEGISVALGVDVREFLDGAAAQQADVDSRLAAQLSEAGVEAIGFRLSELSTLNELGRSTFGAIVGNILRDLQQHELYRRPAATGEDEETTG